MLVEDVLQEHVLEPLGLSNTLLPNRLSDGFRPQPAATPYVGPGCLAELSGYGYKDGTLYSDITDFSRGIVMTGSSGAINSNIADLLVWAKSGTGDSLLSAEMVKRRHQYDEVAPTDFYLAYGMAQYMYVSEYTDFLNFTKVGMVTVEMLLDLEQM